MTKDEAVLAVVDAIGVLGVGAVVQLCADGCAVEADGECPQEWIAARWRRYERELSERARRIARHEITTAEACAAAPREMRLLAHPATQEFLARRVAIVDEDGEAETVYCTLGEFIAENGLADDEREECEQSLAAVGSWRSGGGAVPIFRVEWEVSR